MTASKTRGSNWCFFSSHGLVLICIGREPYSLITEIAERVGLTPRAIQVVLKDLERYGAVERIKEGRRNRYSIRYDFPLRHPINQEYTIRDAIGAVVNEVCPPELLGVGTGRDG